MTQLTKDLSKKSKFKYSNNKITAILKLVQDSSGNWREVSEDLKGWAFVQITEEGSLYKKENGSDAVVYEESIEYIKPYWDLANYVENKASYSGPLDIAKFRIDPMILSRLQLLYYLKNCSLIELKLSKDPQSFEYVSNIDELFGENGLHPSIVDILVSKIRG